MSGAKATEKETADFLKRFDTHEVVKQSVTGWLLRRPRDKGGFDGHDWMEVTALEGGKLLVHGDYDPIVFAYNNADPAGRVHWMGSREWPCGYFVQKAKMGSTSAAIIKWDADAAKVDALAHASILEEDGNAKSAALFRAVAEDDHESEGEFISALYEFDSSPWEYDFGQRLKYPVYAAWATLRRLSHLLRLEKP